MTCLPVFQSLIWALVRSGLWFSSSKCKKKRKKRENVLFTAVISEFGVRDLYANDLFLMFCGGMADVGGNRSENISIQTSDRRDWLF